MPSDLRMMIDNRDALVVDYLREHDAYEKVKCTLANEAYWQRERALEDQRATISEANSNLRMKWFLIYRSDLDLT